MTQKQLIDTIAAMKPYTWPEHDSWTDDQAEDAIVTLNMLIEQAKAVKASGLVQTWAD